MGRGAPGKDLLKPGEKPKDFKKTAKRLLSYFKDRKLVIFFIILCTILSTIFTIVSPKMLGKVTTELFHGYFKGRIDFNYIIKMLLFVIIMYVMSFIFNYLTRFIMARFISNTMMKLREEVNQKFKKLSLKYYDTNSHGDILSRVINDINTISTTLEQSLTQFLSALITVIGVSFIMLSMNLLLTILVLITLPMSMLFTKFVSRYSKKEFRKKQKNLGQLNGHIEEMYSNHQMINLFQYGDKSKEIFNQYNKELTESSRKAQFLSGLIMPVVTFINNIGYVLVCAVGGVLVANGSLMVGDIQAFLAYSNSFAKPIVQVASIMNLLLSTMAASERVFELLDEEELIFNEEKLQKVRGRVQFKDISFSYTEDKLIEDLNLDIKEGQSIAIVGPTGAGKTTLVNLLMRFYDVNRGSIFIDGKDIKDIDRKSLRENIGMVLQDTWLFKGSIRDNISYGINSSEEDIVRAAKLANVHDFIMTLDDGYDTYLNEEASNISYGQKQLITIARVILKNPKMLILDEATSSVDTRTERYIQDAMTNLMKGRTSFIIAHRLSTIRNADLILVMNHGDIVEKGTHKELMEKKGFYYELNNIA